MKKEKIIIFGASKLGKIAYNFLKNQYNIQFFCDNDKNKWGKYINSIEIVSPEYLLLNKETLIIIASMYSFQIARQLYKMNIKNIKTFQYKDLSDSKYSIDDVFDVEEIFSLDLDSLEREMEGKQINNKILKKPKVSVKSRKKVLVIAYIFPPIGGAGVQRTLKFIKNLIDFGWDPIILTVGNNFCREKEDISLLDEIPSNIRIIRVDNKINNIENMQIDDVKNILKLYLEMADKSTVNDFITEYNNNQGKDLLMPDKQIVWVNNVLKEIDNFINWKEIDMLFSTSAPYSNHILAYKIKNKYDIPWVADFRDEWTNNHIANYDITKKYYRLEYLMEKNIVETADTVITVSEISTENYINNFHLESSKVITITNGYDEEDFNEIDLKILNRNKKFTIIFNGTVYEEAPPYDLITAIENLIRNNIIIASKIQMIFVGTVSENMKRKIDDMELNFDIVWYGYMPHKESLKIASKGDLLFTNAGSTKKCKASYTGKIFEYLRLCKPILVFSPKESVLEKLLNKLNRGRSVEEKNIIAIEDAVNYYYDNWIGFNNNDFSVDDILSFERRNLTKKLVEIFNRLTY